MAIVHTSLATGDIPTAGHHGAEVLARAERHDNAVGQTWCLILNARTHRAAGDLLGARHFADRVLTLARRIQHLDAGAAAHLEQVSTSPRANPAEAKSRAQTALGLADRFDSPIERGRIERLVAELAAAPNGGWWGAAG
jgi:hypothetical protein